VATTTDPDPLLSDPDGMHAAAIAQLNPIPAEQRARIRALARAEDRFTGKLRDVLRASR